MNAYAIILSTLQDITTVIGLASVTLKPIFHFKGSVAGKSLCVVG
jgi:hypothetical protein